MVEISYSQVSQYLACPAREKFYLQHIKTSKSAALVYGSVFHKVLAARLMGKEADAYTELKKYDGIDLSDEKDWNGEITFGKNDWDTSTMSWWMESAVNEVLKIPTRPNATELKLTRKFDTFVLNGVVDALWSGSLVDFKLAGKYYKVDMLQAACYALLNGGPTDFNFLVLYKEKIPRLDIQVIKLAKSQKYLEWVLDSVLRPTAKAIENGIFPCNPSYQWCDQKYCSYWSICRGLSE